MVSRAVQKKKERRDRKREREATEGKRHAFVRQGENSDSDNDQDDYNSHCEQSDDVHDVKSKQRIEGNISNASNVHENIEDHHEEVTGNPKKRKPTHTESLVTTAHSKTVKTPQPQKEEISIVDSVLEKVGNKHESELSRKERHKLLLAKRADKQLNRMQIVDAREKELQEELQREKESGDTESAPPKDINDRHHPRFVGGTFWRDRKEMKARTLFVGNLPRHYDQFSVKDLITSFDLEGVCRDKTSNSGGSPQELPLRTATLKLKSGTNLQEEFIPAEQFNPDGTIKTNKEVGFYGANCPVISVDFIKNNNPNAKTKHAYVCFRTRELAVDACNSLDGFAPEANNPRNKLRVNFSDDKDQRSSAIARRNSEGVQSGRGRGRGRGR